MLSSAIILKIMKTRFLSFLTILVLVFAWAGLIYINRVNQKNILTEKQTILHEKTNLFANSIRQYLSLRLDYNQAAMEENYLQEVLSGLLTPMDGEGSSTVWLYRDGEFYQTNSPLFHLEESSSEVEQLLSAMQQYPDGSMVTFSEAGEESMLHAWTAINLGTYQWTVGVSASATTVLENSEWQSEYLRLIWIYVGASLLFLALLIWASSW